MSLQRQQVSLDYSKTLQNFEKCLYGSHPMSIKDVTKLILQQRCRRSKLIQQKSRSIKQHQQKYQLFRQLLSLQVELKNLPYNIKQVISVFNAYKSTYIVACNYQAEQQDKLIIFHINDNGTVLGKLQYKHGLGKIIMVTYSYLLVTNKDYAKGTNITLWNLKQHKTHSCEISDQCLRLFYFPQTRIIVLYDRSYVCQQNINHQNSKNTLNICNQVSTPQSRLINRRQWIFCRINSDKIQFLAKYSHNIQTQVPILQCVRSIPFKLDNHSTSVVPCVWYINQKSQLIKKITYLICTEKGAEQFQPTFLPTECFIFYEPVEIVLASEQTLLVKARVRQQQIVGLNQVINKNIGFIQFLWKYKQAKYTTQYPLNSCYDVKIFDSIRTPFHSAFDFVKKMDKMHYQPVYVDGQTLQIISFKKHGLQQNSQYSFRLNTFCEFKSTIKQGQGENKQINSQIKLQIVTYTIDKVKIKNKIAAEIASQETKYKQDC